MQEVFERVTERLKSEPELMGQNAEDEFSGGFQIQENNIGGNFNNFESSFGNTS